MFTKASARPENAWMADAGLKFSGHESFTIRYGWLPKLYEALAECPDVFSSDERAILAFGLGRNMVKSIRFWGDALGLTEQRGRGVALTTLAGSLLDPVRGRDPYLEDTGSLWRLHWLLTTRARLGAWATFFMDMRDTVIPRARLVSMVVGRAEASGSRISQGTASAHVDILVRTYDAGRAAGVTVLEDALGCPLQELELVREESVMGTPTLRLSRGPKPTLDVPAFAFALHDFWSGAAPGSRSISLRSLMLSRRSPGMVFALDEASLHERLGAVCATASGLELQDDGAGGVDLVATRNCAIGRLEELAW
ncbi:DUF4007 family protein [Methylorubrum extorquens]|uniref:DUF4007 family protein n=1 Tax=Methylorubrum extorquens TaxID=408 RepID=A0AAX3WMX1_METEX|nr:DUF4007 family protein [Methylorubrum extorquens]WHQ72900.1 DUF4007 family protein [Methylorubrum extorquens]